MSSRGVAAAEAATNAHAQQHARARACMPKPTRRWPSVPSPACLAPASPTLKGPEGRCARRAHSTPAHTHRAPAGRPYDARDAPHVGQAVAQLDLGHDLLVLRVAGVVRVRRAPLVARKALAGLEHAVDLLQAEGRRAATATAGSSTRGRSTAQALEVQPWLWGCARAWWVCSRAQPGAVTAAGPQDNTAGATRDACMRTPHLRPPAPRRHTPRHSTAASTARTL
jgi:hypothetical protein